ncbi:MAG: copper chaperone PCu(A)C [Burkholderiales bacterium]
MSLSSRIFAFFLLLASPFALARDLHLDVSVTDAWIRATHPGQQTGAVYMIIKSDKPAKLIKVETPAAKQAEIHSMEMKGGVMVMREMESLALPEKQDAALTPGGNHIMLMNLKRPFIAGEKIPLKLSFRRGSVTVQLEIQADVRKK